MADLCRFLPVKQVAEHFGLSWHNVKEIDNRRLIELIRSTRILRRRLDIGMQNIGWGLTLQGLTSK